MKHQRCLLVTEYYHPHWTGISKVFMHVAESIRNQGHSITVLTTQFDPTLPLKETLNGYTIIRSPYQFKLSRTHYSFTILFVFLRLITLYDTVVINSPNSNVLFYSIVAKLFGKRLIIYHQGDFILPKMTGNHLINRTLEKIFDILTISSFMLADVSSSFTRDYAAHSRVMKYSLPTFKPYIPFIALSEPAQNPKETKSSKRLNPSLKLKKTISELKQSHILIGIAGRFVEEKAYDVLLESLPTVLKEMPTAHLVFAGKEHLDYEPYYERVEPLIKKNRKHITFLGLLDGDDYEYFFKSISVFVISSRSECLAITQLEAATSGIPVVCTDVPGARMLVKSTGFGEIAETENAQSLARSIIKVLKHPGKYTSKQHNVFEFLHTYARFPL